MAQDPRKAELTAELARSRSQITAQARLLGRDLDFATRARQAFARHPAVWIGGAALLGLLITQLPRRRKDPAPRRKSAEPVLEEAGKAGLAVAALKIAFNIARPALTAWVTRRVAEHFDPSKNNGYTQP